MLFIGIDLAWSEKNGSGITTLKGDKRKAVYISSRIVFSDKDIMDYVDANAKDNEAFIAIDAPLVVPNMKGRRLAEELVGKLFRKYDAGAHPANRERLSQWSGKIRGEEISKVLEEIGFSHDFSIKRFEKTRKFFEVYPHPSMVVLFNLDRILRYKAKPKRDYEFRWKEFEKYQKYLKDLEKSEPFLFLPDEIIRKNVKRLKAQALKDYEDTLDSVFCAYISYYYWMNPDKCRVLGDMRNGYILTPISNFMNLQLEEMKSQKKIGEF